jgi:cytochrome c-type biogenesis protein CcmF
VRLAGYAFRFESLREYPGPNFLADEALFIVTRDGERVAELRPEKRFYNVRGMPMTEAGIDAGVTRDLYVSLGEPLAGGAWSVRLHYKACIRWIWLGAILMAAGGLLAASDRRYRLSAARAATAGATATQEA